jgi:hypothetical protein
LLHLLRHDDRYSECVGANVTSEETGAVFVWGFGLSGAAGDDDRGNSRGEDYSA